MTSYNPESRMLKLTNSNTKLLLNLMSAFEFLLQFGNWMLECKIPNGTLESYYEEFFYFQVYNFKLCIGYSTSRSARTCEQ